MHSVQGKHRRPVDIPMPDLSPLQDRHSHTGTILGAVWMVVISLVLFFLPGVNGLIAGLVGGYMIGSISRAFTAAILPALIVAAGLWALLTLVGLPVIGFLAGTAVTILIASSEVALFVGAFLGAVVHQLLEHPRDETD